MSLKEHQSCPICHADVRPNPRYPQYLCGECASKAADASGRQLQFSNFSFSGGCVAQYADTGEPYNSGTCYVDGIECWANEARFGGIVIQRVTDTLDREL